MNTRIGFLTAALLLPAPLAADTIMIAPLQQQDAPRNIPPVIDRTGAPLLAQIVASKTAPESDGRLLATGSVERLDRPLRLETRDRFGKNGVAAPQLIGRIEVSGATRVRIRVDAPAGTVLWVAGSDDAEFRRFTPNAHATWGPTTTGETVFIAAEHSGSEIRISELATDTRPLPIQTPCLQDIACSGSADPELQSASRAIALLRFVRNGQSYVCSGGLVNDARSSGTPYLLTARHCISTAEEAASIEAAWDVRSAACGVINPNAPEVTLGAELIATSASTDVTLLRLHEVPPGRVFLGIDTRGVLPGTLNYRVSHADGGSQTLSRGTIVVPAAECPTAPGSQFLYSRPDEGAIAKGSSGAPLLLPGLRVAGQLLGLCGPDPANSCANFNQAVDGSIASSWPVLAPYLGEGTERRRAAR